MRLGADPCLQNFPRREFPWQRRIHPNVIKSEWLGYLYCSVPVHFTFNYIFLSHWCAKMSDDICSGLRLRSHCRKKGKRTQSSWRGIRDSADTIKEGEKMCSLVLFGIPSRSDEKAGHYVRVSHFLVWHFPIEHSYQVLPCKDPPLSPKKHPPSFPSRVPASQPTCLWAVGFSLPFPPPPKPWPWQLWETLTEKLDRHQDKH